LRTPQRGGGNRDAPRPCSVKEYLRTVAAMYCGDACEEALDAALQGTRQGNSMAEALTQVRALYGDVGLCNYIVAGLLHRLACRILEELTMDGEPGVIDDNRVASIFEEVVEEMERELGDDDHYRRVFRELVETLRDECTLPLVCLGLLLSIEPEECLKTSEHIERYNTLMEKLAGKVDTCSKEAGQASRRPAPAF